MGSSAPGVEETSRSARRRVSAWIALASVVSDFGFFAACLGSASHINASRLCCATSRAYEEMKAAGVAEFSACGGRSRVCCMD